MTVKELIKGLERFDPEMEVGLMDEGAGALGRPADERQTFGGTCPVFYEGGVVKHDEDDWEWSGHKSAERVLWIEVG